MTQNIINNSNTNVYLYLDVFKVCYNYDFRRKSEVIFIAEKLFYFMKNNN